MDDRSAPREPVGSGPGEEAIERYQRSPRDVLRLVVFALTSMLLLGLTIWVEDAILGFEADLIELVDFLEPTAERIIHGAVVGAVLVISLAVLVVPLVMRRYRLLGYVVAGNIVAALLMTGAEQLVDRSDPDVLVNAVAARAGLVDDGGSASVTWFAQTVAAFIVLAPFVTRRWRRAGAVTITLMVVARLIVSVHLPADVVLALPIGATAGSAVLLAFGRPDRRPTPGAIAAALDLAGLRVVEVSAASVDARGSTPYFATSVDGERLFVKVLGEEERAADLLFRGYRFLRFRDLGDERPFGSLRRTVEHEALVSLAARDVGVVTPRLRAVAGVGDAMLLAYDAVDGSSIDVLADDVVTDALMGDVWTQIGVLRTHRIAHRDLRRANVFVDEKHAPWMIDFGFSELAADQSLLAADVAQMLASFAVVVGPERAVDAAIDAVGADAVGEALPRLQLRALSGATQEAVRTRSGLLADLRAEVVERCGIDSVEMVQLERLDRNTVITIAVLVAAVYVLVPQLADLPAIVDEVRGANWAWAPLIVAMSALTYLSASVSLAGAVRQRLPFGPLLTAQVGSSFASKLAPAGLGGMALNMRFLQKQGVDRAMSASGVGLNTVAGIVAHVSLIGVFVIWAGPDAFESLRMPDLEWFLLGIGAVVVLIGLGLLIPSLRAIFVGKLWPVLSRAFEGSAALLRSPGKVAMLLVGSAGITVSYLFALWFAIEAFGGALPLATVGAVYLVGSAVAEVAPTPGGLGAMEAALITGLVAAGLDHTVAVPAVFLYRLATFWLPIVPGWFCFTWLQRHDYL